MSRFLIAVWPFPSHVAPLLSVARALRARGHTVRVYTGAAAQATVEAEGHACDTFQALDEAHVATLMAQRGDSASGAHPLQMRRLLRDWLVGTLPGQLRDLEAIMRRWRPDVVLTETSMWSPFLVLHETHHIPVAVFSTVAGCMLPGPGAPPYGLGLAPPRSWHTRMLVGALASVGERLAAGVRGAANAIRASYNLPPLTVSVTAYAGQMPLYIMPSDHGFDYGRDDLPPSVAYVGPCLWSPARDEGAPDWLAALGDNRPVVHVTEGTVHAQRPLLLGAAAQGLGGRALDVVMTTGSHRDPASLDLGPRASNVRVVPWVEHRDLLPRTDVVVTTGGAGTVMAALRAGVPLVVVPTEWDKPENAQRVVQAGVGLQIAPRRCTPERLRRAVERVLDEPHFREHAHQLSLRLRREDGPSRSAVLLESLATGDQARRSV